MSFPLKILIAPLDWGLGHTSRCLPLIRELRLQGHDVSAAASGISATLLKANFPDIRLIELPGYGITYSRKKQGFKIKILLQLPKLFRQIRKEHRWLQQESEQHPYDLIISDNRYGLYHAGVHSVIMTHQLQILTGMGGFIENLVRKMHYRLLDKFDRCWVVDKADEGLSGRLAHPATLPQNAEYIGWLSQLAMTNVESVGKGGEHLKAGTASLQSEAANTHPGAWSASIMILLSGPEPMRSLLEKVLWQQVNACPDRYFIFIAGRPGTAVPEEIPAHVRYYSHLNARDLKARMLNIQLVICRSGYSTLMDLAAMGKKALLIPTPGQSEQEYLADFLQGRRIALCRTQVEISLKSDIPLAMQFRGFGSPAEDFHHEMKNILRALPAQLSGTVALTIR